MIPTISKTKPTFFLLRQNTKKNTPAKSVFSDNKKCEYE